MCKRSVCGPEVHVLLLPNRFNLCWGMECGALRLNVNTCRSPAGKPLKRAKSNLEGRAQRSIPHEYVLVGHAGKC